ncbi:MAG: tetratricopeptide repeat protein [Acidobacteria bacterium]|nr:MAG: tetratricopeptide repeat protein [Acidobacteriota bacterium]
MHSLVRLLAALIIAAALLFSCGPPQPEIRNVLLISIDTLRADYLSSYGFSRETSPNIDAIAEEGVLFKNVVSPIPITLPAHSSMLTGTIPPFHAVHDNLNYRLLDSNVTLAEMLKERGFATGAIVSSFVLDSKFNLSQGFDTYNDQFEEEHKILDLSERKGDETTRLGIEWLEENRDHRFFLLLHYYDVHADYDPPEPFASRFADDLYAGEVAFVDHCIGQVMEKLEDLGLADTTLVIITGDHGEMLGEHGEVTHSYFIYQSALRVPLIFKVPGRTERREVESMVGLIDIVPTIAGLIDIDPPPHVQGEDLSAWLMGEPAAPTRARHFYAESLAPTRYYGANALFGLVTQRWKYIQTTRPELYDLEKDPKELNNVVEQEAELANAMRTRLSEILESHNRRERESQIELDDASLRRLEALGYLARRPTTAELRFDEDKEDPKDLIEFYETDQRLTELVRQGDYDEARSLCERMLRERPHYVFGHLQMARIALAQDEPSSAKDAYSRAIELDSENGDAHFGLAGALELLGEPDEAVLHFRRAIEIKPDFIEAKASLAEVLADQGHLDEAAALLVEVATVEPGRVKSIAELGVVRVKQGKLDEAIERFREALRIEPERAEVRVWLGVALREQGQTEDAVAELQAALQSDPKLALAHDELGVTLKRQGRIEEAAYAYRQALTIDPELATAHNNLGSLLGSQGRVDEAILHFRRALEADPELAQAHNNLGMALRMTGGRDEPLAHFRAALEQRPVWTEPMAEIAWILATHPDAELRRPQEAVRLAQRAAELTGHRQPVVLDTLAAAYASRGDFERAVTTAEQAAELARPGESRLADEIRARIALYRRAIPFREPRSSLSP